MSDFECFICFYILAKPHSYKYFRKGVVHLKVSLTGQIERDYKKIIIGDILMVVR